MRPPRTTAVHDLGRRVAIGCAGLLCLAALAGLPAPQTAVAASGAASSVGVLALRGGDVAATPELVDVSAHPGARDSLGYVVLNAWEFPRIAAIKAAWPGVKVLVYKDASATVAYSSALAADGSRHDNALLPAGVGYHWAVANEPSWFLRDASGRPIEWADYRGVWPMDVGNPGYQRAWLSNVLSEVRANGWDGVMLDDTLSYLSHPTVGDAVATQIPDDAAMVRSMGSFLATVGTGLKAAGYLAVPNVTLTWRTWRPVLTSWSPSVSGWLLEYFVKWGTTPAYPRMGGSDWASRLDIIDLAQSLDTFVLPVTYGSAGDAGLQTYQRASWLLAWDGRAGASIFVPSESTASHVRPAARWALGAPLAARYPVNGGAVWRRDYSGGTVLVNPSGTSQSLALGASYRDADGLLVDRVTLPPQSAELLQVVAGQPDSTSPTGPAAPPVSPAVPAPTAARAGTVRVGTSGAVRMGKAVKIGRTTGMARLRLKKADSRIGCGPAGVRCYLFAQSATGAVPSRDARR